MMRIEGISLTRSLSSLLENYDLVCLGHLFGSPQLSGCPSKSQLMTTARSINFFRNRLLMLSVMAVAHR